MKKKILAALPERHLQALDFIVNEVRKNGSPPTLRQIARHFGLASPNTARQIVRSLIEKNFLKISPDRRAIQLTPKARAMVGIPILGTVPAGRPIFAYENFQGVLEIEGQLGHVDRLFALRVQGWSMRDAGILDGDFVIVKHEAPIGRGEIGVAFKGDEATVKRIYKLKTGWKLEPANPDFQSEGVPWDDPTFRLGGKVVALFRLL